MKKQEQKIEMEKNSTIPSAECGERKNEAV